MNGCQYCNRSRYSRLLAVVALILFPLVSHSATGHRLAGTEVCYPLSFDLIPTAQGCYNVSSESHRSELWRLTTSTTCQVKHFYGSDCSGGQSWPSGGSWATTTGSGCTDLKNKYANIESCELQQPDCALNNEEKHIELPSPVPSGTSIGQPLCYDYCYWYTTTLFGYDVETNAYTSAFIAPSSAHDNCYPMPPSYDQVIPSENEIDPEEEPGLPSEPLPEPNYNVTSDQVHINGQLVQEFPESGCTLLSGGALLCSKGSTVPTGRDGEKTHQKTGGIQISDGTEYDYYSPLPSTGLTGTGQGVGGAVKDTSGGAVYGGDDCKTPPVCTGNEIQCAQLRQAWLLRCPVSGTVDGDGLINTDGLQSSAENRLKSALGLSETSIQDLIDWTPNASQNYSCPEPIILSTPSWGNTEWSLQPICDLAERLRGYFLLLVRLVAIVIFVRAAKG